MINANKPGENTLRKTNKVPFNYSKSTLALPFPNAYASEFYDHFQNSDKTDSITMKTLIRMYTDLIKVHFSTSLNESQILPLVGKYEVLSTILNEATWNVLWLSPVDDPNLIQLQSNSKNSHFLYARSDEGWNISVDQLDDWCRSNEDRVENTLIYLSNPVAGKEWLPGELKRLCEVATKHRLFLFREEFLETRGQQSLLYFYPERSIVYMNPFCGSAGESWGLGCLVLPFEGFLSGVLLDKFESEPQIKVNGLSSMALLPLFSNYKNMVHLRRKWNVIMRLLTNEVYELLLPSKLKFHKPDVGNSFFLNFEEYRLHFGRKAVFNSKILCQKIYEESGIKLLPGSALGCTPGTLVAGMYLSNFDDLRWIETVEIESMDTSFLYKHCWNCIDGAQKLTRYLTALS